MINDVFANGICQHCEKGPVVKIKAHGSAEQHWQCEACDSTYCWHEYEPIKSVKDIVKKWCSGETDADDYAFQLLLNEFPEGEQGSIHVWAFGGEIPDVLLGKIAVKVALVGHELKHTAKEVQTDRNKEVQETIATLKAITGEGAIIVEGSPTDSDAPFNPPDRTNPLDCKGNVYTGIDDGQPDILNTGIDHEVGHSIQVVREEQISGFNMGIELDTEGVEVIEEFDDDETTLIRRHATVTHRNLMRAQHTAYELMRDKKYEYVNPVRPVTVINNEVGMESYLGESELNTLYQIELVQDSLNLGVLTPEDQVNDLASFINTNCPEKINMDGGAVDIAIALLTEYLEVEKRIKAINILSDDTHDLERGLIDVIRITQ